MIVGPGKPAYYFGLDLGQQQDPSALAILEQRGEKPSHYLVRWLERFPLGTPYHDVLARTKDHGSKLTERKQPSTLVVDATGVGMPVVELARRARMVPVAVTITAGHEATRVRADEWRVPKRDLVSVLQVLLQGRRIQIAAGLAHANTLTAELLNFRIKATDHGATYEAWRQNEHDDLVLAVALAAWYAEEVDERIEPQPERPRGEPTLLLAPEQ